VIEEISATSGVPVAMLLSNDPSKAGSQTARVGWYRTTIRPYCRIDEEKLNEKWLPRFDGAEDLVLAYDLVSFEDDEAQAKRLVGLVAGGILKSNEARTEMGYDQLDDPEANTLYPPSGTTGGAAALAGNVSPGQNDDRQNEAIQ
jgi:phage portal protein BeeE